MVIFMNDGRARDERQRVESAMNEKLNEINCCVIQFPGAASAPRPALPSLTDLYEESRQVAYRLPLPIIGDKFTPVNRRINEAGTHELVEAADEIVLGSYARLAIRETARYEELYNMLVEMPGRFTPGIMGGDTGLEQLRDRRDRAVASLLKIRERVARIQRLEALAERRTAEVERPAVAGRRRSGAV